MIADFLYVQIPLISVVPGIILLLQQVINNLSRNKITCSSLLPSTYRLIRYLPDILLLLVSLYTPAKLYLKFKKIIIR